MGGVIRDVLGHCLLAFSVNLEICSITRAEIRAVITGLELVWEAGHRKALLQIDSRAVGFFLTDVGDINHQFAREVSRFHELFGRSWLVDIRHIYREGNYAANYLASLTYGLNPWIHMVHCSDSSLYYILLYDSLKNFVPRTNLI
ncbi:Putative ribonuclease H protein At1g65750 [Linum perenne]